MLYNQTFNIDQVSFAAEGPKDAQQIMTSLKSANKELKGMMKTVNFQDTNSLMLLKLIWEMRLKKMEYLPISKSSKPFYLIQLESKVFRFPWPKSALEALQINPHGVMYRCGDLITHLT